MRKPKRAREWLPDSIREDPGIVRRYVDRAEAYSNDCGCSTGAAFLLSALGVLILYASLLNGFGKGNLFANVLVGTAFVFGAGILGKLTGIGIARVRLALLYRYLQIRYGLEGD